MSNLESIGSFIRKYGGQLAKDIAKTGQGDINGDKKITPDEMGADTDGKIDSRGNKADDVELALFYIKHREQFPKTNLNNYIFSSIDTMMEKQPVQATGEIAKAGQIDQQNADGYVAILLNTSKPYSERLEAAKGLVKIFSVKGGFSQDSVKKFSDLFTIKVDGILALGAEEILKMAVYQLLISQPNITPATAPAFYAAVAWKWGLEIPQQVQAFSVKDVKYLAESLYAKYKSGSADEKAEINNCISKTMPPVRMWFFMKAAGDKGVDKAIADHDFGLASKDEALKFLVMTIREKSENLVSSDVRKGAFELLIRLTGEVNVDQLINLLSFQGMENYVFQKLMPIVKKEIAIKEKIFSEKVAQEHQAILYKESAGWWRLLAYGQKKVWDPLAEYGTTYALQSSSDDQRTGMYKALSGLGGVSVLDKLYMFMTSRNQTNDYKSGRRAEEVFKNILKELNKGGTLKLFDSQSLGMMAELVVLDPGDTYKVLEPIQGTFGFKVVDTIERKPHDFKRDFVIGYYNYLYMTFLSGGKTWESGISTKPRFSGYEKWACNPVPKPELNYPTISAEP